MAEYKSLWGILALIDVVNFTSQANKLGDVYTAKYVKYFQDKIKAITEKQDFQVIKSIGDAVLLFGEGLNGVLEIMLDLFYRDKPENKYGFISKFRMVAHSGSFQFQLENDTPVDLVSAEGIKVFRMEKHAHSWELVVTYPLYQALKSLLTQKRIEASRLVLNEPLKGFDNEEWFPPFYKLWIVQGQTGVSNLLERKMNELEQDVQTIPVFGNIYPPVSMDKSFINLSMVCGDELYPYVDVECPSEEGERIDKEYEQIKKDQRYTKGIKGELSLYGHKLRQIYRYRLQEIDVPKLYKKYRKGVIFGLPGAGKTTILRHLAYKEFKANERKENREKQVVMFVPCRDIPFYDNWYKKLYNTAPTEPNWETALDFMTWVFLFGAIEHDELTPDQWVEFQNAGKKVKQAFKENSLTLLVDALDEAPDSSSKERIRELFLRLSSERNRVFLTSRPSENIHLSRYLFHVKIPVFNVQPLTMDQVRAVARNLMNENSTIYKRFDHTIWQEEMVVKMAATPITALLVTAYFQAYEKFDLRFPMYDLLLKFILLKVWEHIKTNTFQYKNLELFFKEIKKSDFFKRHRETRILYDALASICFHLFYDSVHGKVQRSVNEETLILYFTRFIEKNLYYYEAEAVTTQANQWFEQFHKDHLLLQVGTREYVFVHSTVMEFLAAYHLVQQTGNNRNRLFNLVKLCLKNENYLELETISIAAGSHLQKGFDILATLPKLSTEITYSQERIYEQGFKCLAEVEWLLLKILQEIRIESLKADYEKIVHENRETVHWLYTYLKDLVITGDKEHLKEANQRFEHQLKLSQPTFLEEYIDYDAFDVGDTELVKLRKELLAKLVQREPLERWLNMHKAVEEKPQLKVPLLKNVLQLDSPGYHPEDKNFNYYKKIIGKELAGFFGSPNLRHTAPVWGCAFSPDGKTIISASEDKTIKLWDVQSGKEIKTFIGHKGRVWDCTFSPEGKFILSAAEDNTLKLWGVRSEKEIKTFNGHKAPVWSCAFSPNGKTILSASSDYTLKLWDAQSGKEIKTFTGHKGRVWDCTFSPDVKFILSASSDYTLKLWDAQSGKEIRAFNGHKGSVWGCAFSPDGKTLISASEDHTLKLWDTKSGNEIRTFTGHKDSVLGCAFSHDGKSILSASYDQTLKLWDAQSGKEIKTFIGHEKRVLGYAFSPDGKSLLSGSYDHTLKLWDVASGKDIRAFTGHNDWVRSCAISPNGKTILSASSDHTLKLWDTQNGKEIRVFTGHRAPVWGCAFSSKGKVIISASEDKTLKLWDEQSGKEIRSFTGHEDSVWDCSFSPDGKTLVSASSDHTLKIWDVQSGKEIRALTGHKGSVWTCAFSSDGNTILSSSSDHTLKLWDAQSGKEIMSLTGHEDWVRRCAFSPDGKTIISASSDNTLKLWNAQSGKEIRAFIGHKDYVLGCTFSPNGKTILSTSSDNTLKLWKTDNGKLIHSLELPWIPFYVVISPTTPQLAITANLNGTLTMFDLSNNMID
ncbi:MAG: NACHT domain-containing protein [Candidatus Aminicenantes bacterium]|nr:MAG: NACHT domain-containing protein [Candidatus Aminicenantes bacterium]